MSAVTKPVLLDETGQNIADGLREIADAIVVDPSDLIDDDTKSANKTWSSEKIDRDLSSVNQAKVNLDQGQTHAGEFVVVGDDGKITTKTLEVWEGGVY